MDSDKIRKVVDSLLSDYSRQGYLRLDDVVRVIDRRNLDPDEAIAVQLALEDCGVNLLDPDESQTSTSKQMSSRGEEDLLGIYLDEISTYRLLTPDEEVLLGRRMRAGELAQQATAETPRSLHRNVNRLIEEGQEARERMIVSNLRLVVSLARRYRATSSSLTLLDLIQEGTLGLFQAVDKFDHRKGYKFSTYATWWIRQSISRANAEKSRTIRIPVHIQEKLWLVERARQRFKAEFAAEPTAHDLAEATELPPKKIELLQRANQEPLSLDLQVGDSEDETLRDFVEDSFQESPEDRLIRREAVAVLLNAVGCLSDKQAKVLRLRFGLDDGVERTLEDIGQSLGVTRERIRQIESKALDRLRLKFCAPNAQRYYRIADLTPEAIEHLLKEHQDGNLRSRRSLRKLVRKERGRRGQRRSGQGAQV